jgi:hypothetical protein
MDVNERVMTVIFSSAEEIRIVRSHASSRAESDAQVTPSVGTRYSRASKFAARSDSEVFPEREITTA